MGFISDLKIMYHMVCAKNTGANHEQRLENFYSSQMEHYDDFRRRLLHGREQMMGLLPLETGANVIDMGGGTGNNIEALAPRLSNINSVTIVDLCGSLLNVAKKRIEQKRWKNVFTAHADATQYKPDFGQADAITFSYSLTMIPNWFDAINHAYKLLKPGGIIGVVDFYVARKWAAQNNIKHSSLTRAFWPNWFAYDNVFLSQDHLPYLQSKFNTLSLIEKKGFVPYMLGLKAPYYIFIGQKPKESD
jgi:S-adenosylmethionine-diacylgycerolhomoserine-N-methlytransferase